MIIAVHGNSPLLMPDDEQGIGVNLLKFCADLNCAVLLSGEIKSSVITEYKSGIANHFKLTVTMLN